MIRPLLILPLLLAPFAAAAHTAVNTAVPMLFRHLNTENGLPQNTVMATLQDSQGFIWLATEDGLSRYDGYEIVRYGRQPDNPESLPSSFVWAIDEDANGDLWLATKDGGLARWSRRTDRFTTYRHDPGNPNSLSSDAARQLLIDRDGYVWVGTTGGGLNRLDPRTGKIVRFRRDPEREGALSSDVVTALHEDAHGDLWVGTADGLSRYVPESGTFERLGPSAGSPGLRLSSGKISDISSDHEGRLWVGTFDGGVNRLDRERKTVTVFRARPGQPGSLSHDEVRAILADAGGRVWVGTADGLNLLTPDGRFTQYRRDPTDPRSLADNYVMSLYEDGSGLIWVGTRGGGVSRWNPTSWLLGHRRPGWLDQAYVMSFADDAAGRLWVGTLGAGLHRYDVHSGAYASLEDVTGGKGSLADDRVMSLLTDRRGNLWIGTMSGGLGMLSPEGRLTTYRARPADPGSLAVDGIMAMLEARDGRIWLGTFGGGVNVLDPQSGRIQRIGYDSRNPDSISAPRAAALAQDRDGFIWVGTEGGGLNLFGEDGRLVRVFRHDNRVPGSVSSDSIYAIHVDPAGRIWVGTGGGGLNQVVGSPLQPDDIGFRHVSKSDGLASDIVYGLRSDASGALWISSNAGLARYEPQLGRVTLFHREHGLQSEEFNFGAHFRTRDGRLCFGGAGGFNVFDPLQMTGKGRAPAVALTRVEVMNRRADTAVPHPVLQSLTLGHEDAVVAFEFAALDFTAPDKNRYRYRLVGFDENWVDLGTRRRISYTNLQPGDYTLEVSASNPDGAWSETPLSLPVSVLPAPWLSAWAKLLYALATVLAGLAVWNAQRRKLRLASAARDRLEREVAERTGELRERNEELGRVSRAKSEFLSRMSHEIRTPMNGVIGMTELLGRTELSRRQTELVGAIHGSARALMQILNEILDLARVESGKLTLETIEFDLRELLEESVTTFAAQAADKGLELTVSPPADPDCRVLGDPLRLRQVLQNLVGNAIKFTTSGEITVLGDLAADGRGEVVARIEVSDTGIGMSRETVARVFEPFAQADESTTRQYGGTGLGLAICHQLVELMGGTLTCESELGIGSTFSLELPFERVATTGELRPPVPMEGLRARVVSRRVGLVRAVLRQARAWGMEAEEAEDLHTPASEANPGSGEILIVDADSQPGFLDRLSPREAGRPPASLVILATTGNVVVQRLEERFGPEAIVVKPVRTAVLRNALARVAGRSTALADADVAALRSAAPGRLAGHVLVVEDNPVNAAVAQGMLAELGCTATVVNGGRRAVACAVAERFDLILMDLHMPDLDGVTATGLIRRAETGIRVPIVALTADAAHAHRDKCRDAGMDDFLGKPFTLRELHARLSRWLPVAPVGAALKADSGRAASVAAGLDLSAIAGIRALDRPNRPRLLPKLVEMFDSSSTQQLRELSAALDSGDLKAARAVAHSLKSACANVGAGKLARLAQALERACAASDSEQARLLAEEVFVTHRPTLDALAYEALEDSA